MPGDMQETDSELFRRLARQRSPVSGRERSWPLYAGFLGLAVAALLVFLSLNQQRLAGKKVGETAGNPQAPLPLTSIPPPTVPSYPMPNASPTVIMPPAVPTIQTAAALPAPGSDASGSVNRLNAPAVIVDFGRSESGDVVAGAAKEGVVAAKGEGTPSSAGKSPSAEEFAARVARSRVDTVDASRLANTALIAPQGTVIPAILETGLNSDLPGYVRAVVSRDVRGFDGSTVLIPRGTKLIGEYKSGVAAGQSRAFVVWSRLLTPDGVTVDIGSPAVDPLGRGGVQGETNSHFLRRFGAAILLSVLSAGLEAGVNHFSPNNSAIVIGTPQQATNVASIALQRDIDVPTTISVPQGTPIRALLARDLDFSSVAREGK